FDACARRRPRRRRRTSGARTARARRLFLFGFDRQAACRLARGIVFTEAFLGDFAGLAPGFLVLLAAIFFLALACISGLALGLVGAFAGGAAARGLLGNLALFGFAHARIRERVGARCAFFLGKRAQHHAGCLRLVGWRGRRRGRGISGDSRTRCRRFHWRRLGLGFARSADAAAFYLLDHHLLAAAVTEALAHHACFRARLERQGLARDAQLLVTWGLRFTHL